MSRLSTIKLDPKSVQVLTNVAEKPFFATVGVTDLAVEAVREYVADVQGRVAGLRKDVQKNVASLDLQPKALRDSAVTVVTTRVQTLADGSVTLIEDTYGDLVKRGETLVGRVRRQKSTQDTVKAADTTVAKAKTTKTQATKAAKSTTKAAQSGTKAAAKKATTTAKKRSTAPRSSAKATTTAAKKTASTATKAVADAAQKVGD